MASIETEKKETDLTNNENNDVEIVAEEPKKLDLSEGFNAKVIVVTSGKGGVGKTTSSAAISSGIALALDHGGGPRRSPERPPGGEPGSGKLPQDAAGGLSHARPSACATEQTARQMRARPAELTVSYRR